MGCCMSKKDAGNDAAPARPATPPQQAIVTTAGPGATGDGLRSSDAEAPSPGPNEAETAAIASAIAQTLATATPSGAASPPAPSEPTASASNEHYVLPQTVFVPVSSSHEADYFRTDGAAEAEPVDKTDTKEEKKDEKKERKKKKKDGGSSSRSSSSSSRKSGPAAAAPEA